jgi:hypothetical protein
MPRIITVDFTDVPTQNPNGLIVDGLDGISTIFRDNGEEEEIEPPSHAEPEIPDMPEECLDGVLGEICKRRLNHLPLSYAYSALLAVASSRVPMMIGKKGREPRTNLYVALVGPVGSGKSVAFEDALEILDVTEPKLITVKAGSAEGLLNHIGNRNGYTRLLFVDELKHLMQKGNIDRSSFFPELCEIYDKNAVPLIIAGGKHVFFNSRLTLCGGIVDTSFDECFGGSSTAGLHDRFILARCPTGRESHVFSPLKGGLEITNCVPVEIGADVWKETQKWAKDHALLGRVVQNALRVATICASFDGRRKLRADMLGPALAFAKYQAEAKKALQPSEGLNFDAQAGEKITVYVQKHFPDWANQRRMFSMINAKRWGAGVFERAITGLMYLGHIERKEVEARGGRGGQKTKMLRYVPDGIEKR